MDTNRSEGGVTPEEFAEAAMQLFDSNVSLEEMRLRVEQLFRRAMAVGALGHASPPDE